MTPPKRIQFALFALLRVSENPNQGPGFLGPSRKDPKKNYREMLLLARYSEELGTTGRAGSCEGLAAVLEGDRAGRVHLPVLLFLDTVCLGHRNITMISVIKAPKSI
jgi:hypothetical protein